MGWIILSRITGARRSGKKREIVIQWGCVLGLGVLLGMARERAFLSVAALLVCAAVISAGLGQLTKTGWRVVLGASGIYFSFVALLDLALAALPELAGRPFYVLFGTGEGDRLESSSLYADPSLDRDHNDIGCRHVGGCEREAGLLPESFAGALGNSDLAIVSV